MSYFKARIRSFTYAFRGIYLLFASQANARIHLLAVGIIVAMGVWLGLSVTEWCLIILCMALVLLAEGMNTAIEFLTDLVSPEYHPLAGKAKDAAAGAVLLSVLICGVVWGMIFLPKLYLCAGNLISTGN